MFSVGNQQGGYGQNGEMILSKVQPMLTMSHLVDSDCLTSEFAVGTQSRSLLVDQKDRPVYAKIA